jgi:hypothetical protein
MKTHIGPIYLILGLMAVATLTIGAGKAPAAPSEGVAHTVDTIELKGFAKSRAFQATSPGMAMPGRLVVLVSDKLEGKLDAELEKRVATALAEARARRKAG